MKLVPDMHRLKVDGLFAEFNIIHLHFNHWQWHFELPDTLKLPNGRTPIGDLVCPGRKQVSYDVRRQGALVIVDLRFLHVSVQFINGFALRTGILPRAVRHVDAPPAQTRQIGGPLAEALLGRQLSLVDEVLGFVLCFVFV
jgi:hypothetical protein